MENQSNHTKTFVAPNFHRGSDSQTLDRFLNTILSLLTMLE